jgi:H+/Cl- antiporter ClcA
VINFLPPAKRILKQLFDRIKSEKVKQNILQAIPFWVASLITGLVAVFYAKGFALAERFTTLIFHFHAWLLFIISPICFILSWWLVKRFAPYSRGSGIPQVMAAVELATPKHNEKIKKLLSLRIILIKLTSSFILVIGGGAIGREGPTIQIAGSIFRKVNELLPSWWARISKKNMIMTGAAAGLAAAFNTPLGGIVFAVEELTKMHISYFRAAIFTAVIIAGLTAQSFLGSYLYLGFPDVTNLSRFILAGVALVAIVAGLMGSSMAKLMWYILKWKEKFKTNFHHILYLLFCSLAIASIACFINENIMGSGKTLLTSTLFTADKYSHWYMPLLRMAGPLLSFTTGASGGVFAPALSAGGSIGSVISGWLQLSPSDTNLLILSGMVAFLSGVTRAPFTSSILVLEMTDRNNLILHLMLAGMVANFVSAVIDKHSIYDHLKNLYLRDITEENMLH